MNPGRIAHILAYLAERYGGPPRVAVQLGRATTRLGAEVSYWGTGTETDRDTLASPGGPVNVFPVSPPRSWYRSPALARALAAKVEEIDILHLHEIWGYPLRAAARLARRRSKPYVITPHGIFMHGWRYRTLKKRLYLATLGRKMLRGASCLHATAPLEIDGFRRVGYRGPVTVVPNGVDPEEFARLPGLEPAEERWPELRGRRVVLFLSRLSPEKGLDQLIPAWADITRAPSYSACVLVLAGPDDRRYARTVQAMIAREGVGRSTITAGMVRGREKLALYRRADVFVLPSYSENFGLVVAEALASGTPVVTTTGTPWRELAEIDAGRWIEPERNALAAALREMLDKPGAELREMGRRGRELVLKKYTWDLAARKLVTVYDAILKGREVPLYPEPVPVDAEGKAVLP